MPSGMAKWGEAIEACGAGRMRGAAPGGELGREVLGADRAVAGQDQARSMALASSRMLPGQSWAISISIASGLMVASVSPRREV